MNSLTIEKTAKAIRYLIPDADFAVNESGVHWFDSVPQPTQAEIDAAIVTVEAKELNNTPIMLQILALEDTITKRRLLDNTPAGLLWLDDIRNQIATLRSQLI